MSYQNYGLGQPIGLTDGNISREAHIGGFIDGVIPGLVDADITLVVGGGKRPDGTYINAKEWIQFKGFAISAKSKDTNAETRKGYWSLSGDGEKVAGPLLSCDDDGRAVVPTVGFNVEFPVKDAINLMDADGSFHANFPDGVIGLPIVGDGGGHVKPIVVTTAAQLKDARGYITDFDNTTGAKKVSVNLWL